MRPADTRGVAPRVFAVWWIMSRRLPRLRGRPAFLAGDLLRAWAAKSGGDDDTAELDGHVVKGGFGLRGVPPSPGPVAGHVVGGVSVQCVPEGDHAETDQPERHRPWHDVSDRGPAHTDDLAGVGEG